MGWPLGWSNPYAPLDCSSSETGLCRSPRRSRGES